MTEEEWLKQLFEGLSRSDFRSRFHLKEQDKEYVRQKGHRYDPAARPGFCREKTGLLQCPLTTESRPLCGDIRFLSPSMPRQPAAEDAWKNGIRSERERADSQTERIHCKSDLAVD